MCMPSFSGVNHKLFHKGITIFKLDGHAWISPYTLTSTELHAPTPAQYAPACSKQAVCQLQFPTTCNTLAVPNWHCFFLACQSRFNVCHLVPILM